MSDDDLPPFFDRMFLVVKYPGQSIAKDRERLFE
jgi:hypothetical protein